MKQGEWTKSSISSTEGSCVEVMWTGVSYLVRDSKDQAGPVLTFTIPEWDAFVLGVKDKEFDT